MASPLFASHVVDKQTSGIQALREPPAAIAVHVSPESVAQFVRRDSTRVTLNRVRIVVHALHDRRPIREEPLRFRENRHGGAGGRSVLASIQVSDF